MLAYNQAYLDMGGTSGTLSSLMKKEKIVNTRKSIPLTILILIAVLLVPLFAVQAGKVYPDRIQLPDGFRPEGIAVGKGHTFYTGSLGSGAIYQGDLRTGEGSLLVPAQTGRVSVGLSFDERSGYLFVSGGATGQAYVYDTRTGAEVGFYQLTGAASFINDVIVTRQAAYFTNSSAGEIYRLPLGAGGSLPLPSDVETIPLGGDWVQTAGFNANGIEPSRMEAPSSWSNPTRVSCTASIQRPALPAALTWAAGASRMATGCC